MQHRKFFELCACLDKTALKSFEQYLRSPYFNKNKKVIALWKYVKKFHPTFAHPKLTKEKAFHVLYPTKPFVEQTFKNLLATLTTLLERFLMQEELKNATNYQGYLLLAALYKRNNAKLFAQKLTQLQKEATPIKEQDAANWYHQYMLERQHYSFQVAEKGRLKNTNLLQVTKQLDYYYIVEKLRYYCAMLNHKTLTIDKEEEQEIIATTQLLLFLTDKKTTEIAVIQLYKHLITLLKEDTLTAYEALKTFLLAQPIFLSTGEMRQVYTVILNFCNKQLKSGQAIFLQEMFDWYKVMLKDGSLFSQGYITPPTHFRNMVIAGLRLQEIDWVANFIAAYKDKIRPKQKENLVAYCLAALSFYRKEYQQTLNYLLAFSFEDVYNHLEHKVLLVKTYYELAEWDALHSLLHAFRIYLTRDKIVPVHFQQPYLTFIRYVEKLCKQNQSNINNLVKQLKATGQVKDREWLMEKMEIS